MHWSISEALGSGRTTLLPPSYLPRRLFALIDARILQLVEHGHSGERRNPTHTEFLLQVPDVRADGRLADVQPSGDISDGRDPRKTMKYFMLRGSNP